MQKERLTISEMYIKYPDQWLFITDCEINENTELVTGVVALCSDSMEKVYEASANYRGGAAVRYSGMMPEGVMFLL